MRIYLTRLPDINTDRDLAKHGYRDYGRFALLRGAAGLWFGSLHSSHPVTTQTGWYWAIDGYGDLAVSARGAGMDGEMLVREHRDILGWLIAELVHRRIISKPKALELV